MERSFDYFFSQTSVATAFKEHFDNELNTRILFSGRFGAGKSTFLRKFFADQHDEYIILNLFPINYSVATNEDVFELIKYDLFSELLAKYADKLSLTNDDFSPLLLAQSYAINDLKIYPFIKALIKATIPKGDGVVDVVDAAKEIYDNFKKYEEKTKADENKIIKNYIDWCEKRKGSIYEYDEISALLTELISRVKEASNNIPVVLIVDDLDRLDPEHVFRLFNIFSAHYDSVVNLNKFNLDKVIFVCDYFNIESMYAHRYGSGVDFEGYINKFYSIKVFEFDNRKHLNEELLKFLDTREQDIPRFLLESKKYTTFNKDNFFYKSLVSIFSVLVDHKQITIRNLDRFKKFDLPTNKITIGDTEFPAHFFFFLTFLHLLLKAIDKSQLKSVFEFLENQNIIFRSNTQFRYDHPEYFFLVNHSLFLMIDKELVFAQNPTTEVLIGDKNFIIELNHDFGTRIYIPFFKKDIEYEFNVFTLLRAAYEKCISKGFI